MSGGKEPDKCAASYMDGIPVKISENFKPPGKVTLPPSVTRLLSSASVSIEYDFSLEQGVLDKLDQWKKHREEQKEERLKKIAEEENWSKMLDETMKELNIKEVAPAHAQVTTPTSEPVLCQQQVKETTPAAATAATVVPATTTTPIPTTDSRYPTHPILTPVPLAHTVPVIKLSNTAFNISDFEADTSSPFDNMELKTLNDMEELAHVLQPTTSVSDGRYFSSNSASNYSAPQHQQQPIATTSAYAPPVHQSSLPTFVPTSGPNLIQQLPQYNKSIIGVHPHINGYASGYNAYSNVDPTHHHQIQQCQETFSYMPVNTTHHFSFSSNPSSSVIPVRTLNCNETICNFSVEQKPLLQNSVAQYPYNLYNCNTSKPWVVNEMYNQQMSAQSAIQDLSSMAISSKSPTQVAQPSSHSNGPDFVQEIGLLMKKKLETTAHTHGAISNSNTSQNEVSKSDPDDLLLSLSPSAQQLVKQVAEMGFPLSRVARAYTSSGDHGKTIVEYLLGMQALMERGYSEKQVERALSVNGNDITASELFLEAQAQLLDLGFSEDKVIDALVKFNSNRDKALEFLIT